MREVWQRQHLVGGFQARYGGISYTNFASMKMDKYCKDLEAKVGDVDKPIIPTRVVRLWKERWEVPKRPGGKGHIQLLARMERKYVGLKLDEMEKGWNIYTVDQILFDDCCNKKFTLRAVTIKYDNDKDESTQIILRNTMFGK